MTDANLFCFLVTLSGKYDSFLSPASPINKKVNYKTSWSLANAREVYQPGWLARIVAKIPGGAIVMVSMKNSIKSNRYKIFNKIIYM